MVTMASNDTSAGISSRVFREGYGPGAWHGPDLKAALDAVDSTLAYWRPAAARHNIAEIALHHAYVARAVYAQLSGSAPTPFVLEGDDWFDVRDEKVLAWARIRALVDTHQHDLARLIVEIDSGNTQSPLDETSRFDLVLGITAHAIYHAGQVQLIKRLREV